MFEQYDDILTVSELAEALKVGSTLPFSTFTKNKSLQRRQRLEDS